MEIGIGKGKRGCARGVVACLSLVACADVPYMMRWSWETEPLSGYMNHEEQVFRRACCGAENACTLGCSSMGNTCTPCRPLAWRLFRWPGLFPGHGTNKLLGIRCFSSRLMVQRSAWEGSIYITWTSHKAHTNLVMTVMNVDESCFLLSSINHDQRSDALSPAEPRHFFLLHIAICRGAYTS